MSNVRIIIPRPRLNDLLKAPGGLAVADALAGAEANLESIRPTCFAELQDLLEAAEQKLATLGEALDDAGMADLYATAVRGIGAGKVCGLPAVDLALDSLCDLLDFLRTQARYDREAIAVHVRAWRLLLQGELPQAATEEVLAGLGKVSRRYAAAAG